MPRVIPRAVRVPSIKSTKHRDQTHLQDLAYLQELDDNHLRLTRAQLRRIHDHLSTIRSTLPITNKRTPEGDLSKIIPPYTVQYPKKKQDPRELSAAIELAQAQATELQKHLEDLSAEPYPYAEQVSGPGDGESSKTEDVDKDDWDGTITIDALMHGGMETFKRRVAAMSQSQKEDALITMKLHTRRSNQDVNVQIKELTDLGERIHRELSRTESPVFKNGKMTVRRATTDLKAAYGGAGQSSWGLRSDETSEDDEPVMEPEVQETSKKKDDSSPPKQGAWGFIKSLVGGKDEEPNSEPSTAAPTQKTVSPLLAKQKELESRRGLRPTTRNRDD